MPGGTIGCHLVVTPAKARVRVRGQNMDSRLRGNDETMAGGRLVVTWLSAQRRRGARSWVRAWIPACGGMTETMPGGRLVVTWLSPPRKRGSRVLVSTWIPACAGMTETMPRGRLVVTPAKAGV